MKAEVPSAPLRWFLASGAVLLAAGTYALALRAGERGALFASLRWTALVAFCGLAALACLVGLALSWTAAWQEPKRRLEAGVQQLARLKDLNLLLFLAPAALYAWLALGAAGDWLRGFFPRLSLFWLAALAGALFLKARFARWDWAFALAASWLLNGAIYRALAFLPEISAYPFSLSWSEASRYYYASLYFSERIYGVRLAPSPLHPSRYLLQALPFLAGSLPLWVHRLWQALLWLGACAAVAGLLARRIFGGEAGRSAAARASAAWRGGDGALPWLFAAWAFLFLFQGPVYYHLLVMPALALWGFDRRRFFRSLVVVLLASAWAGISRVNWFPVPGLLAAALYFLEQPVRTEDSGRNPGQATGPFGAARYLLEPFAWVILGTLAAVAFQALYVLWSGVERQAFASSFTSDLLWHRLLPNPTYPLGVLPAVLLVSAPLLAALLRGLGGLPPLRRLGLWAILALLFAGGVIVSVKIGGGSNLHNLDAFLVLLLVTGSIVFFGKAAAERLGERPANRPSPALAAALLLVPVAFAAASGGPLSLPEREKAERALAKLEAMALEAAGRGEVLFITERHLLTFGALPGIPVVEPYETVFLMEMAMSGNQAYLQSFYEDLRRQRFSLIISDTLRQTLKGRAYPFGEENDVWVERVARPILASYRRAELFKGLGIEVLEPIPAGATP